MPVPGSAASVPAEALAETARAVGMDASTAPDAESALERLGGVRPVLIAGSLYLAGAVLAGRNVPRLHPAAPPRS